MELDDLKNKWQTSVSGISSTSHNKIMELSQRKSYGPVAALKTALRRQVFFIPVVIVILTIQMIRTPSLITDPFFMLFVGVIILASTFFLAAYHILGKMGRVDVAVADQLKRQLRYLQQILLCYRLVYFAGIVMMVLFIETFNKVGTALLIQPWYDVHVVLRISAYVGMIILTFKLSRSRFHSDFGHHLTELKKLLSETE